MMAAAYLIVWVGDCEECTIQCFSTTELRDAAYEKLGKYAFVTGHRKADVTVDGEAWES